MVCETYEFPGSVRKTFRKRFGILLPKRIVRQGNGSLRLESPCQCPRVLEHALRDVALGAYSYSGSPLCGVRVGRYTSVGEGVQFAPTCHPTDLLTTSPVTYEPYLPGIEKHNFIPFCKFPAQTVLGHDVWVGNRAVVMGGVTVGNGAVLATGTVVTKDVPPYAIVGGVPAKIIRYRFPPETIRKIEASRWWEYDLGHTSARIDWNSPEAALRDIAEGVREGRIRKLDGTPVLTLDDLAPFGKGRRFFCRFGRGVRMLKLFSRWICCRPGLRRGAEA